MKPLEFKHIWWEGNLKMEWEMVCRLFSGDGCGFCQLVCLFFKGESTSEGRGREEGRHRI